MLQREDFDLTPKRRRRVAGFTLVELLVTVALAAMVMTLGIPSFQTIIRDNRIATQANDLIADLNLARSEAVKRRARAVICIETGSDGSRACDAGDADWKNGWVVFVDGDGDGTIDDDEVIKRGNGVGDAGGSLTSSGFSSAGRLVYNARGRIEGNAGAFLLCDVRGQDSARQIQISATGRVSMNKNVGGDSPCPTS